MSKPKVVVICPGRGSYNKEELGYLKKYHSNQKELLTVIDDYRKSRAQPSVTELDQASSYNAKTHTAGEHASALIYACSMADFVSIKDKVEVLAVAGNSMGWYITMAVAGALNPQSAIHLINTMGSMMAKTGPIGGQMIYPVVNEDWQQDVTKETKVLETFDAVRKTPGLEDLYISIKLGGYLVFGGSEKAIEALSKKLPPDQGRYPLKLFNHAAFHTPYLKEISDRAFDELGPDLFQVPEFPMIDGRGHIWQPYSTDTTKLRDYTFGYQVTKTYDFSVSIEVALKEFAPEQLILLGPGSTLGGSIAQILIEQKWLGLQSKSDFLALQEAKPFLVSLGREDQRKLL